MDLATFGLSPSVTFVNPISTPLTHSTFFYYLSSKIELSDLNSSKNDVALEIFKNILFYPLYLIFLSFNQ